MYIAQRFALNNRSISADILYRFFTLSVTAKGYKNLCGCKGTTKKMIYANFGRRKVKENEKGDENCRKYATEMQNEKPQRRSRERESPNGDPHGGEEKGCVSYPEISRHI